jgi:hypothetical protein
LPLLFEGTVVRKPLLPLLLLLPAALERELGRSCVRGEGRRSSLTGGGGLLLACSCG